MTHDHAPVPWAHPRPSRPAAAVAGGAHSSGGPVFFLREALERLDLEPVHRSYRAERGRPPYHPVLMVGLHLYGAMRRTYSSRRLAERCRRDVGCMYPVGRATPD